MSEITKLASALVKAQREFPPIDLNKTVEVRKEGRLLYTFDYATLAHIKELTDPVLHKNGLAVIHLRDGDQLVSKLVHESGEFIESKAKLRINERSTQQEEGSIVSYQKRYNHTGLLGIVAEKDDDANIADGNEAIDKRRDKPIAKKPATVPQTLDKPADKIADKPMDKPVAEAVAVIKDVFSASVEPKGVLIRPTTTNFEFLKAMKAQKERLGNEMYYEIMGANGYEHANEITDSKTQKMIWLKMDKAVAK